MDNIHITKYDITKSHPCIEKYVCITKIFESNTPAFKPIIRFHSQRLKRLLLIYCASNRVLQHPRLIVCFFIVPKSRHRLLKLIFIQRNEIFKMHSRIRRPQIMGEVFGKFNREIRVSFSRRSRTIILNP